MQTYNIDEVTAQFSKLVEMASQGGSFVIAKSGKPMVKVVAVDAPQTSNTKRLGFMAGHINVPDDFNDLGVTEIQILFNGDSGDTN